MSTILKALRRVEDAHGADRPKPALEGDWLGDEAEGAAAPDADEPPSAPRSLRMAWPFVASALAGFGLVLSGAWLWSQRPADAAPPSQTQGAVVAVATQVPEPEPVRELAPEPAAPSEPTAASAEAINLVQRRLRDAAEQAAERPPAAANPIPPPPRAPDPAPPVAAIPEPVAEPTRPVAKPPVAARQALAPEPEPPPAARPAKRTELVAVIPSPPEIRIERTRWHPTPQKRTARVSVAGVVHDVRESDDIDGLRVVEIRPSTVVFMHEGVRLERKPGS
jgi:hypothetical protein